MNAQSLLAKLTSHPAATGLAGGAIGGGLIAALGSKKGRKTLGTVAQVGGLAALGGLAYHAWNRHQQNRQAQDNGTVTDLIGSPGLTTASANVVRRRFLPSTDQPDEQQRLSRNLVQAMIAAAKADGAIDETEWQRIDARAAEMKLGEAERGFLTDCLREPANPARIAGLARNPEEAAELYLVSLLTIDADQWSEQAYLEALREQLAIEPELAAELQAAAVTDVHPVAA